MIIQNDSTDKAAQKISNSSFPAKLLPLLSSTGNTVICPHGIATVLSMVAEGANSKCLAEILTVLGFDSLEELREAIIAAKSFKSDKAFSSTNKLQFKCGWRGVKLLAAFENSMKNLYHAEITESAASEPYSELKLENAATFKAGWQHKLVIHKDKELCFHNVDGSSTYPVFLSTDEEALRYYMDEGNGPFDTTIQAVALPYKVKKKTVPYELVLIQTNHPLDEQLLGNIFTNMETGECIVTFPKFTIEDEFDLIPMMKALGVESIFCEALDPLDKMATKPFYVNSVTQKVDIKVDKNGTEAKAITVCYVSATAGGFHTIPIIPHIYFTEPFHYFLRNTHTKEILFMGKVNFLKG